MIYSSDMTPADLEKPAASIRRRRMLKRYGLAALLLALLWGIGAMAVWTWQDNQFVAEVRRLGGQAHRFPDPPTPWSVWLCERSGKPGFTWIDFVGCGVDDAWLARHRSILGRLPTDIALDQTGVGDEALKALTGLDLRGLGLGSTQVTDNGLGHLADMDRLEWLRLGNTRVTDEGLRHLARLELLRRLDLRETSITDDGLSHLQRLSRLEFIDLYGTQATREGVAALQEALPACEIIPPY